MPLYLKTNKEAALGSKFPILSVPTEKALSDIITLCISAVQVLHGLPKCAEEEGVTQLLDPVCRHTNIGQKQEMGHTYIGQGKNKILWTAPCPGQLAISSREELRLSLGFPRLANRAVPNPFLLKIS